MSQSGEGETSDLSRIVEEQNATINYLRAQLKEFLDLKRTLREGGYYESESPKVNRQTSRGDDLKVDIPEFEGRLDGDEFLEWVRTVERVFDYKNTDEEKKVKIVALKLRKYASTWWANKCAKREREGKDKIRSWEKMKKQMKEKFLPSYYMQENFTKLQHLQQDGRSVEEYGREFETMIMRCDLKEDDHQTLVRFLNGLDSKIRNIVELQPYACLDDLINLAHKVDKQQRTKMKETSRFTSARTTNFNSYQENTPHSYSKAHSQDSTALQNNNSKQPLSMPNTPKPNTNSFTPRRCFKCQGLGHISSECPNRKMVNLVEFDDHQEENEEDFCDDAELDEEIIYPDEGELLVMRRALSGVKAKDPNPQREAIFHTKCTVKGKICSLIIDGGSCTNVASKTMVDKLNLTATPHPKPYMIQWLNQNKAMENIIRLNVGGPTVDPSEDSGLRRTWFGIDDDYMIYGLNSTISYDDTTINYTVATLSYTAPELVYLTMREMGPYVGELKKNQNLTWLFEVDVGFNYLVRLHFCELDSTINSNDQRSFDVSINNQMGAHDIDVFALTGGIFIPMYRDFVTLFEGSDTIIASVETRGLLSVTLTPDPTTTYNDVMLNGLEIFKLSSSNGSLAAPNPTLAAPNPTFPLQRIGIGICMLIALILLYKKMNSMIEKSKEIETLLKQHGSLGPKRHTYADLKRITNSFKIKLGEGGYGIVYKGKLHCGDQVAVKILKRSSNRDMDMVEFINEVASIGNTNHKNIVKLLGFCYEGSKRALIYDYMPCGSLEKFTHGGRDENNQQLSWKSLFEIAIGIARGLEYLHQGCNTRILHFDIKPQNILLDENYCPKISDFGLAKICPQKDSIISMSDARGTGVYIAHEVFFKRFGGVSHKSDVYSYGMWVLEIVGCRKNIDAKLEHSSEQYFPHWIYKQLEEVEEIDQIDTTNNNEGSVLKRKMVVVGLWCIQTNPFTRPNMTRVVEMLEGTLDLLQIPPIPSLASPLRSHEISTTLDEILLGGLFVSSI
ncbi:probable receptor-like protein kinase At5g39020 isoform X2 [Amaranthus tricolor]|uniref:probable receptor-like protein kinase At5g39020 isoform X2 n=1 Tax=Amaranthus tricolor TaxID=29722 RepID=UPI0025837BAC|nr:probable receptor-like protein kinase At5g39020 isoform X2 [Amaranthus tricolor]